MKPDAEYKDLFDERAEEEKKNPIIADIMLFALITTFIISIPLKIWVLPILKGEEITKKYYINYDMEIIYPKEYVRKRNGEMNFCFDNKNNISFFLIRMKAADEQPLSERAEKYINDTVRINNGNDVSYNEVLRTCPNITFSIKNEETISLDKSEEIKAGDKNAVLAVFKGTEYYIAAVIIDYSSSEICLIEFVLMPDENNEQMIRDILESFCVFGPGST